MIAPQLKEIAHEVALLRTLSHQNITNLLAVRQDAERVEIGVCVCVRVCLLLCSTYHATPLSLSVMDYCSLGSLAKQLKDLEVTGKKGLDIDDVRLYMKQILYGLKFLCSLSELNTA